jgi:hypothetical protein
VEDTTDARLPAERRDELAPFNRLFRISRHRFDDSKLCIQFANRSLGRASARWASFMCFGSGG